TMIIDGKKIFVNDDCNSLSIYNFYLISETRDFRYLIKGFKGGDDNHYIDLKENEKLSEIYDKIYKDYNELISNKNIIRRDKAYFSIKEKTLTYELASSILETYKVHKDIEVLVVLNDLGFVF